MRAHFHALERVVYLNTATAPPAATPVLDALRRALGEWEGGIFDWQAWEAEADATRSLFAGLIGADQSRIALMASVSEAAATVARSLRPPGRIVVGSREFRSNLFPWLALRERGFEVVEVPARGDGVVPTEALVSAIDQRTVLVAVTEVQSANGFRVDVREIGRRAEAVGARFFLSAMQSLGVLRLDVRKFNVDFVVAHGYKWLLAPRGAAWLYVRSDRDRELAPLAPSWKSVNAPYAEYYGGPLDFASTARKLDTSLAWFPWIGARAALELLRSFDASTIESHALALSRHFRDGAGELGLQLVPEERPSHIVAVVVPDPELVRARLLENSVVAAVRGPYLRVGFHGFNDTRDVETALKTLGPAQKPTET